MGVSPHGLHFREQRLAGADPLRAIAAEWAYKREVALRQADLYEAAREAALAGDVERYANTAAEAEACRP